MFRGKLFAVFSIGLVLVGCGDRRYTSTERTASEQLLVAAAVDRAAQQLDFAPLKERKVYIDDSLVDRADKEFVVATIRARALLAGAMPVPAEDGADYVLELRSGAVGTDKSSYILGIPATEVPTLGGGTWAAPEAAIFKSVRQVGATRLSFVVYSSADHRLFYASGPAYGFSNQRSWWIMGAGPNISDNIQPPKNEQNTADTAQPMSHTVAPPMENQSDEQNQHDQQ